MTSLRVEGASLTHRIASKIPSRTHLAGLVLRIAFLICLVAITVRVALPQSETIWTAYDTPGDLVRLGLGLAVCVWIAVQLLRAPIPTDAQGQQTWLYFGLVAVPFGALCLIAIW
jgi:hypothetical protein